MLAENFIGVFHGLDSLEAALTMILPSLDIETLPQLFVITLTPMDSNVDLTPSHCFIARGLLTGSSIVM